MSSRYCVKAEYKPDDFFIECKHHRIEPQERIQWLSKSVKRGLQIALLLLWGCGFVYFVIQLMPHVTLQLVPSKSQWAGLTILAMFCVGAGLVARGRIGRCHTAKHMAIQAYRANGDTSLEVIRAQDGLDSDCLCQIIPPAAGLFLVAFVVSILAAATDFVGLAIWLGLVISVNLACACCLLLLSKQQRCSRIPGNKWLTLQLHRRLIRVEPTDVELTVAYRALTQLVKLHES